MQPIVFILIVLFVIINIVQTWLIFVHKLLIKGGVIIGLMEAIEIPLIIFLIVKGGVVGFLIVVLVETVQWSAIAYFSTRSKIK